MHPIASLNLGFLSSLSSIFFMLTQIECSYFNLNLGLQTSDFGGTTTSYDTKDAMI